MNECATAGELLRESVVGLAELFDETPLTLAGRLNSGVFAWSAAGSLADDLEFNMELLPPLLLEARWRGRRFGGRISLNEVGVVGEQEPVHAVCCCTELQEDECAWLLLCKREPISDESQEIVDALTSQLARCARVVAGGESSAAQRYRFLLEELPCAVYHRPLGKAGSANYVAPQIEAMLGHPSEAFSGNPGFWHSLIHPDDVNRVHASWVREHGLMPGEEEVVEYRLQHMAGHYLWVRDHRSVRPGENGGTWVLGLVFDISEVRRAEERREELDALWNRTFDLVGLPMAIGAERELYKVNHAFAAMLGYEVSELEGMEGVDKVFGLEDTVSPRRLYKDGGVEVLELEMTRRDGSQFPARLFISDVPAESGGVEYRVGVVEDRTELERHKRDLDAMFELSSELIAMLDLEGHFHRVNPAFHQMLGWEPSELEGPDIEKHIAPEDLSTFQQQVAELRQGKPITGSRLRFRRKDGSWRTLDYSAKLIPDTTHFYVVARDVTDQVAIEQQVRATQRLEALGRLAGAVAHDFNNLLAVVKSYASFLLEALEDGTEMHDDAQLILDASSSGAALTSQLLAFSRRQVQLLESVNLNKRVETTMEMVNRLLGGHIEIQACVADEELVINGDVSQLEQVVMNLVVNARDAMPNGGRMEVATLRKELTADLVECENLGVVPGEYAVLLVQDSGVGIEPDLVEKIFEPFFTTKEGAKGTGLGLSTVYGIVKQHNGTILVDSSPGEGTCVRVFFPLVDGETSETTTHRQMEKVHSLQGLWVMVVEDNDSVRTATSRTLRNAGLMVSEQPSASAALAELEEKDEELDLLLTDVVMPQKSGYQLAKELKQERPDLKIVYMSGYSNEDRLHRHHLTEHERFIQKPFTPDELVRTVANLLDSDL